MVRWKGNLTHEDIRHFVDFNRENGAPIFHYRGKTAAQLEEQKANHLLPGLHVLASLPEGEIYFFSVIAGSTI